MSSRSVEHIIPESIGNAEHVLPPGIVCDKCNNYFATKVEGPLLATPYFRSMCYSGRIRNKKGNSPRVQGVHLQSVVPVDLIPDMDGSGPSVAASRQHDEKRWIASLLSSTRGTLIIPVPDEPEERLFSRLLAKIAIEALALQLLAVEGGVREITEKREFDPLRDYARRAAGANVWPFCRRSIYLPDRVFVERGLPPYQILHEWTFLYTQTREIYFVLALFGMEYALNMGGPELDGYKYWLAHNNHLSPLYPCGTSNDGPFHWTGT